jgi:hypothetical protein
VSAGKAVIDIRHDWFQQLIPAMIVNVVEGCWIDFLTI